MVQVNNGSWLHWEDFCQLNMVTEFDAYPLANMFDFTAKAAGCVLQTFLSRACRSAWAPPRLHECHGLFCVHRKGW
jgi:hypothetical protein